MELLAWLGEESLSFVYQTEAAKMEIGVILSLSTPMWERLLVGTGRYWEVLVGTGGYWGVLVGTGGYWIFTSVVLLIRPAGLLN